ncbi:MAG: hypothetical protein MHMPM18_000434 [Marteilia pararefringens]
MKNDEYGLAPLDKYSEQRALKYRGRNSSRHQLNHQDYYESRSFTEDYDGNNNQSKSSRSEYGQRRRSEESESDHNVDINKYRRELVGQYAEQQQQVMNGLGSGGSKRCDACNARLAKSEGYHISVIAASQLQQGTSSSESSKRTAELYKYLSGTKAKSSSSKKEKGDEKVPSSKYSESKARNNNSVAASESKKRASAGKEKSGKTGLNIDAHLNRYYSELRKLATDGEFSESHAEKFQKRIDNLKVLRKAGEKMNSELFEKFKTKFDKMKRLAESKREIGASAKSGGGGSSSRRSSSLSRYQQAAASTRSSEKKQRAKDLALGGESSKSLGSSSSRRNMSRRLK